MASKEAVKNTDKDIPATVTDKTGTFPVVENDANIVFVGKEDREPEKLFENGMGKKIIMPPADDQRKPFYHERASEIIAISPYYKAVRDKG